MRIAPRILACVIVAASCAAPRAQASDDRGDHEDEGPSERCASCHVVTAEAFALSGHAHARRSFVFEASLVGEDPRWCVSCHAPRGTLPASARAERDAALDDKGVGCVACHDRAREQAIELASPELCATCHQFGFLRRDERGVVIGMTDATQARDAQQNTFAEWRAWRSASGDERTCQACHMKEGDHSFGGVRRIDALAAAIVVELAPGRRALRVRARDVGHALPTGDIMRFISIEAASDDRFADAQVVARFRRDVEMRTWPDESAPRLGVVRDERIDPARDVVVPLSRTQRAWRVIYHLVSEEQERRGLLPLEVSRIEVLRGGVP